MSNLISKKSYTEITSAKPFYKKDLLNDIDETILCDRCKQYGYCLALSNQNSIITELKSLSIGNSNSFKIIRPYTIPLTRREISNIVNVKTDNKYVNTRFGKKLQQAHDLFHHDDFEQASYMYQDMIETRNDCEELCISLAASFFFLKEYQKAAIIAERLTGIMYKEIIHRFIQQCELHMTEQDSKDELIINNDYSLSTVRDNIYQLV